MLHFMKSIHTFQKIAAVSLIAFGLTACEDVIDLNTTDSPPLLVVDGWINDQEEPQTIRLSLSAPYFTNNATQPVLNAEVTVTDDLGNVYRFEDKEENGHYTWNDSIMGKTGRKYFLEIKTEDEVYKAESEIKRVPTVDSIVYTKEKLPFKPDNGRQEGYIAEFYARDFQGTGDTYWIKPIIKGKPTVAKPTNITLAWDASYNAGGEVDGLIFILPLRQAITTDSLFLEGETAGVELHSITNETFEFLKQVREQSLNGGLFAIPMTNVRSNVVNQNPSGQKALGYFGASAISRMETTIIAENARPEDR